MALCIVSGPVRAITGVDLPGTVVVFTRGSTVLGQDGAAVVPREERAVVDDAGILSIALYPGHYMGTVTTPTGRATFRLGVPDTPTALLADCIDQMPPLTLSLVQQAQTAAGTAAGAAGVAVASAGEVEAARAQVAEDAAVVAVMRGVVVDALATARASFPSRAAAVTAANGGAWNPGAVIEADGVRWRYDGASSTFSDMPGWTWSGDRPWLQHFDAHPNQLLDSLSAIQAYRDLCDGLLIDTIISGGVYAISAPIQVDDSSVILYSDARIVDLDGNPTQAFVYKVTTLGEQYNSGSLPGARAGRVVAPGVTRIPIDGPATNAPSFAARMAQDHTVYVYDGKADYTYVGGASLDKRTISYGGKLMDAGDRASGSVGGISITYQAYSAAGGTTTSGTEYARSELIPISLGLVAMAGGDFEDKSINLYNDIVVRGPVGGPKEAYLGGFSITAQTYYPYEPPSATYDGSYGMSVATKSYQTGWQDSRTQGAYPLRAMLALVGFTGPTNVGDGIHPSARAGAIYGLLVGGGREGEGGGSQWLHYYARSKFVYGAEITDYTQYGINVENPNPNAESWVYGLRVAPNAGVVSLESGKLAIPGLPTSADGLVAGRVWRDNDVLRLYTGSEPTELLRAGSYGIGNTGAAPVLADLDDPLAAGGMWAVSSATPGVFPDVAAPATVFVERTAGSWSKQTLTYRAFNIPWGISGLSYVRVYDLDAGAWRPWRRIMTHDSVVGTITAGAANAIIEKGVNASGVYTRWADGTQECWTSLSLPYSSADLLAATWTYPAAFLNSQKVFVTETGAAADYVSTDRRDIMKVAGENLGAAASIRAFRLPAAPEFSAAARVMNVSVRAVGRWY